MKKNIGLVVAVISVTAFLSGCVKGDFHVTVNKDGSAVEDYILEESTMIYSNKPDDPINQFKDISEKDGFNVSTFKDGDYVGVRAKRNNKDVSKIITDITSSKSAAGSKVSVDKGWFHDVYTIDADIDMRDSRTTTASTNGSAKETSSISSGIGQMFSDKVDLKLDLTLPVDTEENNASRVLAGQNRTYEWDLIVGQDNKIKLRASVLKVWNIVYASLIGVAVIVVSAFGIMRHRKTKRAAS